MSHSNINTSLEPPIVAVRDRCAVCQQSDLERAVDLPKLPLTGIFCRGGPGAGFGTGIDQALLICHSCGHGQLWKQVDPAVLYGSDYSFRTTTSAKARQGADFFLETLREVAPRARFDCVLDVGCNDLHLLRKLEGRARARVGIDPIWGGRGDVPLDEDIQVIGSEIEDVDLERALPARPDLVLCRHTLEHLAEPRTVLERLFAVAREDALFIIEVPSFETLIARSRYDQVFHQHLHYFTLRSLRRLAKGFGGRCLGHRENYRDWGAIAVAFRKTPSWPRRGRGASRTPPAPSFGKRDLLIRPRRGSSPRLDLTGNQQIDRVRAGYRLFQTQLAATERVLSSLGNGPRYGYGAAQMLPTLAYHLGSDLSMLDAVLDDDPSKDGLGYWNLPLEIRHSSAARDLQHASVLITAVDNAVPILRKLLESPPREIVHPLQVI